MHPDWLCLPPPPRATLILAATDDLLVTGAGLWRGGAAGWAPLGTPPLRASAAAAAERTILAGTTDGRLVYSADQGRTWSQALADEFSAVVTCLAVSPSFAADRVALAGTDGAGVLRTSDGGRRWRLVNVGLEDYAVQALAVSPSWGARELAFAACADGVYRSPNGGRAWKRAGRELAGVSVIALAVSPRFADDATLYAGTEEQGIYISRDAGASWAPAAGTDADGAIGGLWCGSAGDPVLAACDSGRILCSDDAGRSWSGAALADAPLLALGGRDRLYSAADGELLASDDAGRSWGPDAGLAAVDLTQLALGNDGELVAYGPTGGAWLALADAWSPLAGLDDVGTLHALAPAPGGGWFAASASGLWRAHRPDAGWELLTPADEELITVLAADPHEQTLWAGSLGGGLWQLRGNQWRASLAPGAGPIAALHAARGRLALAQFDAAAHQVTAWLIDAGGACEQIMQVAADIPPAALLADDAGRVHMALGTRVLSWDQGRVDSHAPDGEPLLALASLPDGRIAAASGAGVSLGAGADWSPLPGGPGRPLALAVTQAGALAVLAAGGALWRRRA